MTIVVQQPPERATPEVPGRQRAWMVYFPGGPGGQVQVRHYVTDLAPGEDLDDTPETHDMAWDDWLAHHGDYGLDVDGSPVG